MADIQIHPPGTRTTDHKRAKMMGQKTPTAFKAAQHLLAKTDDYINKRGLFKTESKRVMNLEKAILRLERALEKDGHLYIQKEVEGPAAQLLTYMNTISDIFPNWQPEYKALNDIIPGFYEHKEIHSDNQDPPNVHSLRRFFGYLLLIYGVLSLFYFHHNPPLQAESMGQLIGYYAFSTIIAFIGFFMVRSNQK